MGGGEISLDDPRADDVRRLLDRHLAFARAQAPPEDTHALDLDGLLDPAVTFFSFRQNGELLAIGALKHLGDDHVEVKSMHTAESARGLGVGRAMLEHLVGVARDRGYRRVSLETGLMPAFAPARSLYASAGFEATGPFGDYGPSPNSAFMTLALTIPRRMEARRWSRFTPPRSRATSWSGRSTAFPRFPRTSCRAWSLRWRRTSMR